MKLSPPPRRALPDTLVPMIDMVLFLIVFFMLSSEFVAPEPFAVSAPEAEAAPSERGALALFLSADGVWGFVPRGGGTEPEQGEVVGPILGPEALPALAAARAAECQVVDCATDAPILFLRADQAAPASAVAGVLAQLAAMGFADIRLQTLPR